MDKPSAFFHTKHSIKTYVKILQEDQTRILAQLAINNGFASYVSQDFQARLNPIIEKTADPEEQDLIRSCLLIALRLHNDRSINAALSKVMGYAKDLVRNLDEEFLNQPPEISQQVDPVVHLLSAFYIIKHSIHLVYLLRCLIQNQPDFRLKLIFSDLFDSIKEQDKETYLAIIEEFSMASDPMAAALLLATEHFEADIKSFTIYRQLQITAEALSVVQLLELQVPPTISLTEKALNKLYQPLFKVFKTDLSIAVKLLDIKDDSYLVSQLFQFDDTKHQIFSAMGELISQYEDLNSTQRELADICIEKINNVLGHKKFIARHPELKAMYDSAAFSSESSHNSLSI